MRLGRTYQFFLAVPFLVDKAGGRPIRTVRRHSTLSTTADKVNGESEAYIGERQIRCLATPSLVTPLAPLVDLISQARSRYITRYPASACHLSMATCCPHQMPIWIRMLEGPR